MESTTVSAGDAAIYLTVLMVLGVIFLLFYIVPALVNSWMLYKKAGEAGWKAIIPVYSSAVMAKIARKPVALGWTLGVVSLIANYINRSNDSGSGVSALGTILSFISIGLFVYLLIPFAKRYDRGVGYWLLVIFLPIIAVFLTPKVRLKEDANVVPPAPAPVAPTVG